MPDCYCLTCGAEFDPRRRALGYQTCMDCGHEAAIAMRTSWCIVPTPKGHYTRVTRKDELKQLNQKVR
jgi:DNA-directed RNA polymerase subunit RPC12/RpoP